MASAIVLSVIVLSKLMMGVMLVIGFMLGLGLGPMLSLGGLSLLAPLTLLGLLALPIIWWVMRITPPKPRRQTFPPLRILQDVETRAQTPDKTPIWLLLFRLLFSTIIIFGLAKPVFQAQEDVQKRPITLIIDQSVTAAPHWKTIIEEAKTLAQGARRDNLSMRLITSAQSYQKLPSLEPAQNVLDTLKTLAPVSYVTGEANYATLLDDNLFGQSDIVWLSSGLGYQDSTALKGSNARIITPQRHRLAVPISIRETAQGFESTWHSPTSLGTKRRSIGLTVEALASDGSVIAAQPLNFDNSNSNTSNPDSSDLKTANLGTARFVMPAQLRARVTQLRLAGLRSAAAHYLLDDSFGRPIIGILTPAAETNSPLLTEPFYAKQALLPYADIFEGDEAEMLALDPSILIMPDSMKSDSAAIRDYLESGGMIIRFAGPRLAARMDALLPVKLRSGGRAIGGALAWEEPQKLAPFSQDSPFFGLAIPEDVTISKQVMAQPGIETDRKTWARLEDGSPIVTSDGFGQGRLVLYHVTAGPDWSNLAINGLYVDMLQRLLPLAKGRAPIAAEEGGQWVLDRALDAYGNLTAPPARSQLIQDVEFAKTQAKAETLPGYYRQGTQQRALQALAKPRDLRQLQAPSGTRAYYFGKNSQSSLSGLLIGLGAAFLALDALFSIYLSGRLSSRLSGRLSRLFSNILTSFKRSQHAAKPSGRKSTRSAPLSSLIFAASLSAATFMFAAPLTSEAQTVSGQNDKASEKWQARSLEAALGLHLAFIETQDSRRDDLTRSGLESLKEELALRTTIEPLGVHGVLPDDDNLHLYPFIYWLVGRDSPALTPQAAAKLNAYMAAGGTIIFDTADEGERALRGGGPHPGLARVTEGLDIPELKTIGKDHVLTKSYYLLQIFAGRWANGPVYVEAKQSNATTRDGVSPVIIGSADWAASWAEDENGRLLITLSDDIPWQREMAKRFGINLAMYALAGNYKADQVHSAELIKRFGTNSNALISPQADEAQSQDGDPQDNKTDSER